MKNKRILLTGGGTGGHWYPLLSVADEIKKLDPKAEIFYAGPRGSHRVMFEEKNITCYTIAGSKIRRYAALGNLLDIPKFFWSILQAWWRLYFLMPDVVFSKGGPGSFPVVLAAKFYFIPVLMHESDSAPSLNSRLAAPFAKRIAISFTSAADYFPKNKTAFTGNPVRGDLFKVLPEAKSAKHQLGFDPEKPLIFILGGSQGSTRINDFVADLAPKLIKFAQVFHQTGADNLKVVLKNTGELPVGYKVEGYLDLTGMQLALAAADLVISRAGAGAIYEIAAFHKPSILLPLSDAANDHQRKNAYEYAATGAAEVLEESNLVEHLFLNSVERLITDKEKLKVMGESAKSFYKPDAATVLAKELLNLAG
jgi:UDP-N-acetylglucosamine--N-acetylmuramyl-(pentapeptide) pyrophosphoryl-undecaprenol N-acetylglucosamine transferase